MPFLQRELEQAYAASRDSRAYNGQPLVVGSGKSARTVMLVSTPVDVSGQISGNDRVGGRSRIFDPPSAGN